MSFLDAVRRTDLVAVGFVNRVFMNDTTFANEDALADPEKLRETLKEWLPMSSSTCQLV